MGMRVPIPGPGVQHTDPPQVSSHPSGSRGQRLEGCGCTAKEALGHRLRMAACQASQCSRPWEGDHDVRHRPQPCLVSVSPLLGLIRLPLRAGPLLAGARARVRRWAWLTIIEVAAKGCGPARCAVLQGFPVAWQPLGAVLRTVVRAMAAEALGSCCPPRASSIGGRASVARWSALRGRGV